METKESVAICGHSDVRVSLERIARVANPPQSFLFSGPKHLGKSLVAREFAGRLIGTPISQGVFHPDLLILDEAHDDSDDQTAALSVEKVREMQLFLSRFPEKGRYRVVLIDNAERLTKSAENALLKALEEPNTSSVIILVSAHPGKLLPTVRSRLFPVAFSLLAPEELQRFFPRAAHLPEFFFSLGLPGLVKQAVDEPEAFDVTKGQLRGLFQLSRLSWAERITLAEQLAAAPETIEDILDIWLIGLSRRQNLSENRSRTEALFLERVIETIDFISSHQGNPRLSMERLFTSL